MRTVAALAPMLFASAASATDYAVGLGEGCTHSSFLSALAAATADGTTGPHVIRLAVPTITLGDSDYVIADPQRDIDIIGGFASCTAETPTGRTVLNRTQPNRSVLEVRNSIVNSRRLVILRRLTLQGGNLSTGFGGGIAVTNKATVALGDATSVENNQAPNGGGVSLVTVATEFTDGPRLVVVEESRVCGNTANGPGAAGNGGGVYMVGAADLQLQNGRICDNQARRHGGGVYMAGLNQITLGLTAGDLVAIEGNSAGTAGFSSTTGFGGGVYAGPQSGIGYITPTPPAEITLSISNNQANFGGGLFAEGAATAGSPFSFHELRNVLLSTNLARGSGGAVELRNAVDLRLRPFGAGRCQFFGAAPCVIGIGNRALNTGEPILGFGAGGFARLSHVTGAPRPALRIAGALFTGNEDANGTASVVDARGDSSVRILRSVFVGNSTGGLGGTGAVIEARSDVLFGYNTVLDNEGDRLLSISSGTVNATGSILHAPGLLPFSDSGGGALVHGGCLLSHTTEGLPPGVTVASPQLDDEYTPLPGSAVIDRCTEGVGDVAWPAGLDAYGEQAPIDIAGVPNAAGPWDIGAVEAQVVLFSDGFESP